MFERPVFLEGVPQPIAGETARGSFYHAVVFGTFAEAASLDASEIPTVLMTKDNCISLGLQD